MVVVLLVVGALLLAYANGANDNFKGVATLYGSGRLGYRAAIGLATVTTLLGSLLSLWVAQGLVRAFSGKGLVPDSVVGDPGFLASVSLGAGATVLAAAAVGLPISTTHALVGSLVGAGVVWAGAVDVARLGGAFLLPLLASPFLALALTGVLYAACRRLRRWLGVEPDTGLRVQPVEAVATEAAGQVLERSLEPTRLTVVLEEGGAGARSAAAGGVALDAATALDAGHVLSAGALGFARGLNDTPKIAALLVAAPAIGLGGSLTLVALVMAAGGLLTARRVAETMSHEITPLNSGQGFTANAVSAGLVIFASRLGIPVSTTHVTCGALFGIGVSTGEGRWATVGKIALAWVATLPIAAALAALAALALGR